jgi:hypothetical protein
MKENENNKNNCDLKEHICSIIKEINDKELLNRIYRYVIFIDSKK